MHATRAVIAVLVLLLAALTGCVSEDRPETCGADETTIELRVTATAMEPNDPAACRDQLVRLHVYAEVDGVLHIHGLDAVVPATTISAGEGIVIEFGADQSGQFPIELHRAGSSDSVSLGILTLHER